MKEYRKVPQNLNVTMLREEFGDGAVEFYTNRIEERIAMGRIYRNPLKTIWLWAHDDRRTNQGFWTTYRGHTCRRKKSEDLEYMDHTHGGAD